MNTEYRKNLPGTKLDYFDARAAVDAINFPSGFYRRDIGWREVARESSAN